MKMDEMNAYFESKGFTVEREYHPRDMGQRSYYTFVISKNNSHRRGTYVWPEDQQYFMDHMIKKFEDEFGESTLSINDVAAYAKSRCCTLNIERSMCGSTEIEVECGSDTYIRNFDRHVLHGDLMRAIKGMVDEITRPQNKFVKYCENDVKNTTEVYRIVNGNRIQILKPKIKNVIFNPPATIVIWTDGTKTVVKCQDDDIFDPEKGLAMAISKKALGNKRDYYHTFLHYMKKYEKQNAIVEQEVLKFGEPKVGSFAGAIRDTAQKAYDAAIKLRNALED